MVEVPVLAKMVKGVAERVAYMVVDTVNSKKNILTPPKELCMGVVFPLIISDLSNKYQ